VLIFSGGNLGEWALEETGTLHGNDILVGADRGAWFLVTHGFHPDVAMGDFDSVAAEQLELIRDNSGQFIPCDPLIKTGRTPSWR
jgi:thiamine pyrophosphokinase